VQFLPLLSGPRAANLLGMDPATPNRAISVAANRGLAEAPVAMPTAAGQAALAAAQAVARKALAELRLRLVPQPTD
jgi:hypothetical protein